MRWWHYSFDVTCVCQSLAIDWYCSLNQYRCKARFQKR